MNQNSMLEACDRLLDELHAEASVANHAGAAALAAGDYAGAREAMALGEALSAIRADVAGIMERLESLIGEPAPAQERGIHEGRAPDGSLLPEDAYRVPILSALVELGGSAPLPDVLERVWVALQGRLTPLDLGALPSNPRYTRWRNRAQWCRNTMREEGLIAADSPHGIWEITDAGRRWLEEQEKAS